MSRRRNYRIYCVELLQFRVDADTVVLGDGDVLVEGDEAELPVVVGVTDFVSLASML